MEISWQILLVTVGTMGVGLPCAFSLAAHWIYGWPNKPGYTRYLEAFKPRSEFMNEAPLLDIPFGRHGNKLDLYYPSRVEELALTPALVFVYGGAWGSGQKSTYCLLAIQMAKQLNKIVICPDYSTYPKGTVMEMVQDVLDCVLWIKENACAFNIHKENIVLMGHSAGAHLCALSVLLLAEESSELNIDHVKQRDLLSSIKAVVGLSGVYHILDHYLHETWRGIEYLSTMCKAMKDPDYFDHYSPTLLISSLRAEKLTRLPAFVLLHGTKDNVVPVKSTLKFSEALTLAAVKVALYILPNISHTEIVTDLMAENRRYYLAIFGCIKQEVNLLTTSY